MLFHPSDDLQSQLEAPLETSSPEQPEKLVFRILPLIRLTLLGLYLALTVPLPFLLSATASSFPKELLVIGQGGLVYYFLSTSGQAYLLPMRVAGFARLVRQVEAKTGIDTTDVKPLAQPWMYLILLGLTLMLLGVDSWTIWTALAQGH